MISFELTHFPQIILLGLRICNTSYGYSLFRIQNYELVFVYQGSVDMTVNAISFTAVAGDCVLLKPNDIYSARTNPSTPTKYYIIHFKLNCPVAEITLDSARAYINQMLQAYDYRELGDIYEIPQISFKSIFLMERYSIVKYQNRIFEILENAIHERNRLGVCCETMISIYFCEVLVLLSRLTLEKLNINMLLNGKTEIPRPVQEVVFFIHENYMRQISLRDISKSLDISQQYLIRMFKKQLNTTPLQYINLFRISRAKELLKHTSMNIKEISYAVGFQSPYYFSRLFKKIENMTPTEYRNKGFYKAS